MSARFPTPWLFAAALLAAAGLTSAVGARPPEPPAAQTTPAPRYLPPPPEMLCSPDEAEEIDAMPAEVERLDVMPAVEESEPHYELLVPAMPNWTRVPHPPCCPLSEVKGPVMCGGVEMSCGGTITANAEPLTPVATPCAGSPNSRQVILRVTAVEMDHRAARVVGMAPKGGPGAKQPAVVDDGRTALAIKELRDQKHAHLLSEPMLLALDGQQASLFVGSELPVPASGGKAITYLPCGLQIDCTPHVSGKDCIRLTLSATLSRREQAEGVTDYRSRTITAEVEMRAGQTFAVNAMPDGRSDVVLLLKPELPESQATAVGKGKVTGGCFDPFCLPRAAGDRNHRFMVLTNRSEGRQQGESEETVHELLLKCQRELARDHYAAAYDLAQQALTRDARAVEADPLVTKDRLLQRVKEHAELPLGTVEPCEGKKGGRSAVPPGEGKAVGSNERVAEVLLNESHEAFRQAHYDAAAALARRAALLDPNNGLALSAFGIAQQQADLHRPQAVAFNWLVTPAARQHADAMRRFQLEFKEGRFEDARTDALLALTFLPGDPIAVAALRQVCEALSRQPHPAEPMACPYIPVSGTGLRPMLPPADPAVVNALQKLLLEGEKASGPAGGTEEAEPKR